MTRDPWYKVVLPRSQVRVGRPFNSDEFAIALEQVVAKIAPPHCRVPARFFWRTVPPELWNRLGTKLIPKLRFAEGLTVGVEFSVEISSSMATSLEAELQHVLIELNLDGQVCVER